MTKAAHTPGPWEYEAGEPVSTVSTMIDGEYSAIAFLSLPNHAANARLIAAAPDLLEALEWIESYASMEPRDYVIIDRVRAAIAKAKGGAE